MSKPTIDEQIEAVRSAETRDALRPFYAPDPRLGAAVATLKFVRDHQEEIRYAVARKRALAEAQADPAIQRVLEVFPEAQIEGVGEAD